MDSLPSCDHLDVRAYGSRPHEREVLAEMIRLRRAGLGYWKIASVLNDRGIPTRRSGNWHPVTVKNVLRRVVPELCPPRVRERIPQEQVTMHHRDLDRHRKRRAYIESEGAA